MCDASGATSWSHDLLSRITAEKRTIAGSTAITNTTSYTYFPNLDGSVNSITYPTGRIITYGTPSAAGRTLAAQETAHSINYVMGATYAPQGALETFTNGASISNVQTYNSRLQPLQLYYTTGAVTGTTLGQLRSKPPACPTVVATIMSRNYNFAEGATDNGNVKLVTDCLNTNRTQHYDYDRLNRIKDAYTTGTTATVGFFGEDYTIDAWGNLTNIAVHPGQVNSELLNIAPASTKNQVGGFCYDAAGNFSLAAPPPCPSPAYTYDAENRLVSTAGFNYVYDGDGKRVIKCSGTYPTCASGTLYWMGTSSAALDETSWTGAQTEEYIFFNGKRLARRDGTLNTVEYYFSDHLGSADVITGPGGGINKVSAYYPYGGEIPETGTGFANNYKFTGKEHDTESGLDEFGARHYGSSLGRFMTPDPGNASVHRFNPQSWNAYSYVNNRPLALVDPNGLEPVKAQAGTVHGFAQDMNRTTHRVGLTTGAAAARTLSYLGETDGLAPKNTAPFNGSANRYVYTSSGGWVDMVHFAFYAGRAAEYKAQGNSNPVGSAVQDGYWQERVDTFTASWSAYSYEDLPSDLYGATFGAEFFDPTSSLTLAEQIEVFLSYLSPMAPTSAPNYAALPNTDSRKPPMARNHSTVPMYTLWLTPQPKACVEAHDSSGQGTGTHCQ